MASRRKRERQFGPWVFAPDLPGEEWRTIYDGFYEVSNCGRVRRAKAGSNTYAGRMLKPDIDRDGYARVTPCVNNRAKERFVHHLVAEAFVGPRPSKEHEINHKDGVKLNNTPSNLEWVLPVANQRHAMRVGLKSRNSRGQYAPPA